MPGVSIAAPNYEAMSVKELRTTAASMGVNDDKIEEARDSNDPQALFAKVRARYASTNALARKATG